MTNKLNLIHVRNHNKSLVAKAIKAANRLNRRLVVIDSALADLRNFKVVSNTKARKATPAKAVVKQPKLRTGVKPPRLTVAHTPLVSNRSLRSFGAVVVRSRQAFALNNIIPTSFFMEAKSMLDNTNSNLPMVAQSMTMNYESIDDEFGITNNNKTSNVPQEQEESMTTESTVTSDEMKDFLKGGTTLNVKSAGSINQINEANAVPTWEVITDEERTLVQAANEVEDYSLEVHKSTWLNFGFVTANASDFKSKVQLIEFRKADVNRSQLEVEFAKFCMNYKSLDIREDLAVFGTTKSNGFSVECAVDFAKGLFSYQAKTVIDGKTVAFTRSTNPLAIRKFAIVSFNGESASAAGIYHAEQTFALFASLIDDCWTVDQFKALMGKMKASLVIDTLAQSELNNPSGRKVYGRRGAVPANNNSLLDVVSIQARIEFHKIGLIPVIYGDGNYVLCKDGKSMTGTEVTIADKVFAPLGLPVHTDKNARKYLVYGAGSMASGLAYNADGNLVSATPITDATKGANRLASESFHHAINQSADWNGRDAEAAEGETLGSQSVVAIGNDRYARTEGINMPTTFAFSAFNLNNGIIETNATKSVRFSFDVPKSLSNTVSISQFDEAFTAELQEVATKAAESTTNPLLVYNTVEQAVVNLLTAKIKDAILAVDCNLNASAITLGSVEVLKNKRDFDMTIDPKSLDVKVTKLTTSGEALEVTISAKGIAPMVDKRSPKLRGNTKKGTAYPTNTQIIRKDGTAMNWTTLLTGETLKACKGMLELVAHSPKMSDLGYDASVDLVWDAGTLAMGDTVLTPQSLLALIKDELCDRVTIIHEVSKDELDSDDKLKALISDSTRFTVKEAGDLYLVTEHNVLAFESYATYQVELSCADENSGAATLGVNEQYNLAPFHQSLSAKLDKLSKAEVARTKFMNADFENSATVVDYQDAEIISVIAGMLNADNPKQSLMNLAKAYPGGIKFVGEGFEAWCPFSALLHFTKWNGSFPSASMGGTTFWDGNQSEEVITKSLTAQVIELIYTLASGEEFNVRDLFRDMSGVRGFLKSLRSKTHKHLKVGRKDYMANIRKAGKKARKSIIAHHQKVVGDLTIGRSEELPVVRIHPANPMDVHVGDVVAISRCPLPMFTICKVELDDTLDRTVVAVNPITWIKSNLGDFDGDTIYITELKRLTEGLNRTQLVELGKAYNNKYSAVATHWDIFDKSTSPLAEEIVGYDEAKELNKFSNFAITINPELRAANLVKVNNHYAYAVGTFFDIASNLTESLGNKFFNSGEPKVDLTPAEVLASHRAWIQYEEDGLGGFKEASHKSLEEVKNQINTEIASPGSLKPRTIRGRVVGDTSINFLAIQAAAVCKIGAGIYKEPKANIAAESLYAQAFKRIAKKDIHDGEFYLWSSLADKVSVESLVADHRFGEQMVALGKIRGNWEQNTEGFSYWV